MCPQLESYRGKYADLYDFFYADKPYAEEARVVASLLRELAVNQGKNILELACGTGRHAIQFHHHGFQIRGLDFSSDMVRVAREKLSTFPGIQIDQCDMRQISSEDNSVDSVICLFDSIGYLIDNLSIVSCWSEIFRVLRPGGVAIVEFWHAPAMLRGFEPLRERTLKTANSEIYRRSQTKIDVLHQTAEVSYQIRETSQDGKVLTELSETQRNRFFQCQEMASFVQSAGLKVEKFLPAFDPGKPIDLDTWHVLAVARRPLK